MASFWDWLLLPIDPQRAHSIAGLVAWHARFMMLAWGVMIPLGIVIARYFKIWPGQDWPRQLDNRIWWRSHLFLQIGGFCAALTGLLLIVVAVGGAVDTLHGAVGWGVMVLATVQVGSGWLRGTKGGPTDPAPDGSLRGDHYDMTPRRRLFESFHKIAGYTLLLGAIGTITLGLWHANAPHWMWIVTFAFWGALVVSVLALQLKKPPLPTYQAIWGPNPDLPGNIKK